VRRGRNPHSVDSPSTLGGPTPPSLNLPSTSPRQNLTSRLSPDSLNVTPRRTTQFHHAYGSGGISSQSNAAAVIQRPSQLQPLKSPSYNLQSRMKNSSSMQAVQRKPLQTSRDTTLPLRIPEDLAHTATPGDEIFIETENGSHNGQLMSSLSSSMSSSNSNFGNLSRSFAPVQTGGWPPMAEKLEGTEEKGLVFNTTSSVEHSMFLPYQCIPLLILTSSSLIHR
jgi:hypothetical protein